MKKIIWLLMVVVCSPVFGVSTSHWTHTTEADFKEGTFRNVVANNLGDLKLSRAVKVLLEQDPHVSAVYCLAEGPDHTIYAGTGPQGILLQIKDDKVTTAATIGPEGTSIFSLVMDPKGRLFIGTGGEKGRVLVMDKPGDAPREIFAVEGVQYVWAMQQTPDGMLYVATGPTGKLYAITPEEKSEVVLASNEHNLLSLLSDGKDMLYVGTDPNGLVYRVNRKTKDVFVLYNAPESEVTALALDGQGNLYAATGQASEDETTAGEEAGTEEKVGRPENGDTGGVAIPSEPPAVPTPPELPNPAPGEPAPIPRDPVKKMVLNMSTNSKLGEGADKPGKPKLPAENDKEQKQQSPAQAMKSPKQGGGQVEQPATLGNAIYQINRDGFVREIFRQSVVVYSMLERDGVLLVGTGTEGLVYQVNPAAEETLVLAKVDPKQVLCLLGASDGRVIMGLANVGGLAAMSSGFASQGTFTSPILDASQVSQFGKIHLQGTLPTGSTLSVATRSGNVKEPTEPGWSKWSDEMPAMEYMQVPSPSARFFQYRLAFTSKDGQASPVVDEVDVAYEIPNLPPQIKSIKILASGKDDAAATDTNGSEVAASPKNNRMMTITWEATDGNSDAMQYSLYFRQDSRGPWILLKDKIKEAQYEWDTRSVADGRYQIKVVASDAISNPKGKGLTGSRTSDPVIVDNTPPVIGDLVWQREEKNASVKLKVVDRTSTVAGVAYSVDSSDDWQVVEPSDNIYDSPEETVSFTVPGLPPGPHQVTIRATDSHGNQAFENVLVK